MSFPTKLVFGQAFPFYLLFMLLNLAKSMGESSNSPSWSFNNIFDSLDLKKHNMEFDAENHHNLQFDIIGMGH